MPALLRTAVILVAATWLLACVPPLTPAEQWCQGLCSSVYRCGFSPPDCLATCVADRPSLADLSDAMASAQSTCLAKLSCAAIEGDDEAWKTETQACWRDGFASLKPTARTRAFCQSHARALFDCGYAYDVELCAKDSAAWSEAALKRLSACEASPSCDAFVECDRNAV
jgi:hypothetical protein